MDRSIRRGGYSVRSYFDLVEQGELTEDDHVELLDGLIVCEPPHTPAHASGIVDAEATLRRVLGDRAHIRAQLPLVLREESVPEPDIAVVPGTAADYREAHPTEALLVIEVSQSTLPQDRLTKSRIYAGAGIPEYWIVNLREGEVEVMREPDPRGRVYRSRLLYRPGSSIEPLRFAGASIAVSELIAAVPRA